MLIFFRSSVRLVQTCPELSIFISLSKICFLSYPSLAYFLFENIFTYTKLGLSGDIHVQIEIE